MKEMHIIFSIWRSSQIAKSIKHPIFNFFHRYGRRYYRYLNFVDVQNIFSFPNLDFHKLKVFFEIFRQLVKRILVHVKTK